MECVLWADYKYKCAYVAEEQEKETKVLLWNKKSSQDATGDTRVLFLVAFCFFLHVQLFSSDLMPL